MPKCKKVFKNLSLGFYTDTIPIENDVFTSRCEGNEPALLPRTESSRRLRRERREWSLKRQGTGKNSWPRVV